MSNKACHVEMSPQAQMCFHFESIVNHITFIKYRQKVYLYSVYICRLYVIKITK